jgi:hypothetical protein
MRAGNLARYSHVPSFGFDASGGGVLRDALT